MSVSLFVGLLGALLWPGLATASPWTLEKDKLAVDLSYNFQFADQEYLPGGELQQFPLEGAFSGGNLALGGRYGFTDAFEGYLQLNFKQVSYKSTPFLRGDTTEFGGRQTVYEDRLLDFSDARAGAGDFYLGGRYNLFDHRGIIKLTTDTSLKLPAGYEEPDGTFEEGEVSGNTVSDDVTLGDGQVDLTQKVLFGAYSPKTRTFARVGTGFELRFGPPGHRVLGGLKVGQNIGDSVIVFAGTSGALTVTEGEPIGQSFITRSPEKSAAELGADDIEQIPITLDKDYLKVAGGVIFRLKKAELQFSYSQIVAGRNIPMLRTASVTTVFSFPNVTESSEAAKQQSGEAEKSGGAAEQQSGEAEKSSGAAEQQSGEAEKSGGAAKQPSGEAEKSSEAAKQPSGEAEKSSEAAEQQSGEAEGSGDEEGSQKEKEEGDAVE